MSPAQASSHSSDDKSSHDRDATHTTPHPSLSPVQASSTTPMTDDISSAAVAAPQSRVRFSLDAGHTSGSSNSAPSRAAAWDGSSGVTLQDESQLAAAGPAGQPDRTQSRTRSRGYSLRRSLFTQNMQRQSLDHGSAIELGNSSAIRLSPVPSTLSGGKGSKTSPTVTIQEDKHSEDEFPKTPVRLSDPALDLPMYTRWLQKQGTQPLSIFKRIQRFCTDLKTRASRANEICPSVNGRHVRVNVDKTFLTMDERTANPYVANWIRSCRYTPLNFVPRQLCAQFGKLANFYFLCVSILQMIPGLSTTGTYTTIVPLMIFVCVSMAKEGYDDWRRNRLDKEENERLTSVLCLDGQLSSGGVDSKLSERTDSFDSHSRQPGAWRVEKWQDLRVGDVVLLKRDQPVPADLVLLHSSNASNIAYIETKSLDGETNLKSKKPLPAIAKLCEDELTTAALNAEFVVEDPNLDLYKFDGKVTVEGETRPITNSEVVYRGSTLRNTDHVFGLVIYSGEECKIRMNANKNPRIKAPTLQSKVNRVVIIVAGLVFFIAIIMSIANRIWVGAFEDHAWYLRKASVPFGHILTSFIIMFNTMLPLSLYVSLEIVKLAQIYFMNDIDMYDPESDIPMEARTSAINEELGQVSYIFSDKTGTLTNNCMRFRKMSVAGMAWLHDFDLHGHSSRKKLSHKKRSNKGKQRQQEKNRKSISFRSPFTNTPIKSPSDADDAWQPPTKIGQSLQCGKTEELLEYIRNRPHSVFARKAKFFILGLALCHTCVPEKDDEGNVTFQAESPDELALVTAAQDLGYIVSDRQSSTITVKTFPNGEDDQPCYETYEVLDVIEFSSARKRMSIIVRTPDSRICVFSKGADTTIRKLLRLRSTAEASAANVDRRASLRKSMEVQEALRRKSVHTTHDGVSLPTSPIVGRKSSVSLGRGRTVRESIDAWLTEREVDVDVARPRRSSTFYTSRESAQLNRNSESGHRPSVCSVDSRASFQTDDMDVAIDESVVVNDHAIFEHCFQHIDDFATEGLRTLLYGYRYVSEEEYGRWKEKYHEASTSLVDRQEKIEAVGDLIECQFELLGATAIEDKLQDGVPDAIDRFRRAGIKMWMLTGDKRETAINIGHSCRLIKDYSTVVVLDHELGDLHSRMASAVADITNQRTAHSVLVVDGQTLSYIDTDPASKALFTDLAIAADSVVCCRASPSQKAGLVRTIRTKVKGSVTLAIGDGANDIAMIQEAHVGIGIAGKEGLQAARTSDYSIAQFRFLLKLLLVHGRWNYIRVCKYTLGTFWKEMIFYIVQAMYQRWTGYTGTSLYEPWSLSMFNTLFTSLPVIFIGIFEKDLTAPTLLAVPELYSVGRLNQGFNIPLYAYWAVLGGVEALIIFFSTWGIYGMAPFTHDQRIFAMGTLAFTACVILISGKLQIFDLHNKSVTAVVSCFLSIGGWVLWNILLTLTYSGKNPTYDVKGGLFTRFGTNGLWWLVLMFAVLAVSMLEITIKAVKMLFRPSETEIFQAYERDIDIKKRFEESAADLLQQGWDRGNKKSSQEIAREEALEAERAAAEAQREAEIQAILDRPRTMEDHEVEPAVSVRRRHSAPQHEQPDLVQSPTADPIISLPSKKSCDISDMFRSGFGTVRKGTMK